MLSRRWRPVFYSVLAVLGVWGMAVAGYWMASSRRVTPEKVRTYVETIRLGDLSGVARAEAIKKLAGMLNQLSWEDRQRARMQRLSWEWFQEMTEEEKGGFIEATMPTGFKQMLTAFEQLPEDRRRKAVGDALRNMRREEARLAADQGEVLPTNAPPPLSEELQARVRTLGLKTFYSQSSAQTKAELAPVLEELQRMMESGRFARGSRPGQ